MKVLSLFSGIGAFEKALERLGIEYELVNYCEIDKYASRSYSVIHNVSEEKNLGDITKIDINTLPKDITLITHGSPCQDFSVAGHNKGGDEGSGTRSSLMYETIKIVKHCQPKYVIWENVKNVISKKHRHNFNNYLKALSELGYLNYWQVLNSKDYGVPQNRERVFVVSINKDLKVDFKFPNPIKLKKTLKDVLETDVDDKYLLSQRMIKGMQKTNFESYKLENKLLDVNGVANTIIARFQGTPQCIRIKEATKKGYKEAFEGDSINLSFPASKTRRGRVGKQVAQTITCHPQQGVVIK